jgi:hypothetical protein
MGCNYLANRKTGQYCTTAYNEVSGPLTHQSTINRPRIPNYPASVLLRYLFAIAPLQQLLPKCKKPAPVMGTGFTMLT